MGLKKKKKTLLCSYPHIFLLHQNSLIFSGYFKLFPLISQTTSNQFCPHYPATISLLKLINDVLPD